MLRPFAEGGSAMSAGIDRRSPVPLVLGIAFVLLAALFAAPADAVGATPTIRLLISAKNVTVERSGRGFVSVDPGAYVTPVGEDFELVVNRPDYDTPVTAKQVDPQTGTVLRTIPEDAIDGWSGLKDFASYEVLDDNGAVVASETLPFCPNSFGRARLSDDSPLSPTYPWQCDSGFAPFTRGSIWGIDEGWAVPLIGGGGYYSGPGDIFWRGRSNNYTIRISIEQAWVDMLSITPAEATADVHVTVVPRGSLPEEARTSNAPAEAAAKPFAGTPIVTQPDADTLPDLVALPGWNMGVQHRRDHDYLNFWATEWNQGPGPLLIDGFRTGDEPALDAYQYFMRDGEPVGRALIDQIHYHNRHNHWHFDQFTQYSLLDADRNLIQISNKRSWCLAPTDAIDLSVPNADWGQQRQDVG